MEAEPADPEDECGARDYKRYDPCCGALQPESVGFAVGIGVHIGRDRGSGTTRGRGRLRPSESDWMSRDESFGRLMTEAWSMPEI